MRISIGNSAAEMIFGRKMICESLEAEPLSYSGEFPGRDMSERLPVTRHLTLEGYIVANGSTPEEKRREMGHRRRILSGICSPHGEFFIMVDDKRARLCEGELTFHRKAPFSGDSAEHFTLRAVIVGGFFLGESITVEPMQAASGTSFPLSAEGSIPVGEYGGNSLLRINNRGDAAVGFTAELSPVTTASGFRLENPATGQYISVPKTFGSGDIVKISTLRDDLYVRLRRGGKYINLTGYAEEGSELFMLPAGESTLTVTSDVPFEGTLSFAEAFVTF